MITNERQYKIVRSQAERFRESLHNFDELKMIRDGVDPVIVAAHRDGVSEQLRELERQLHDYDDLRAGKVDALSAQGVIGIGDTLIQARIARGLSQKELAERLGMKEQQVQRYEHDRYLTANLSRIAEVLRALNLQSEIILNLRSEDPCQSAEAPPRLGKLPAREMLKRGWIDQTTNKEDLQDAAAQYVRSILQSREIRALHKLNVRTNGKFDNNSLIAWKARVLDLSRAIVAPDYDPRAIDGHFIQSLVRLSRKNQGPVEAVRLLQEHGIRVVFERHLPATHLDGAAMLDDNSNPVIGITLRYDRLDNFWFVLMHELGHVVWHRERGLREGFFDDEQANSGLGVEREADEFALNALIPAEAWEQSFVRFTTSRQQVVQFAEHLGIGAAIVCGRIRKERGDYTVFADLLGRGQLKPMLSSAGLMEA